MVFFRTVHFKVDQLTHESDYLEFSASSRHNSILQYVRDPSSVHLKRKSAVAFAATLRFLYESGSLLISDSGLEARFRLPYSKLYQIAEVTLRNVFGIKSISPEEMAPPPQGTFSLRLTSRGEAGRPGFRIDPSIHYNHKTIAPSQVRGPLIAVDSVLVLMPEVAWECLRAFSHGALKEGDSLLGYHYKLLSQAQTFARYDYIRTDRFIQGNPITAPQSVALSVTKHRDALMCTVHPEGVPKEAFDKVFTRTGEDIPDAFSIESEDSIVRVFFDSETKQQLRQIAKKRVVKGTEIRELLNDPATYFGLPQQSTFWDLSGLSGRVAGWGLFVADSIMVSPAPISAKETVFLSFASKLPVADGISEDFATGIEQADLTAQELRVILVLIDAAIESGEPYLELQSPPIVILSHRLMFFRHKIHDALKRLEEREKSEASPKLHLLAAANAEEVLHTNHHFERERTAPSFFKPLELPSAIRRVTQGGRRVKAFPHQADGVSWLLELYNQSSQRNVGCLLADDMGLGKTFQVIAFLASIGQPSSPGPTLIICPTTLLKNWMSEIESFTTEEAGWETSLVTSASATPSKPGEHSIIITNYEQIYARHRDFFLTTQWKAIFFDEAQKFKNPTGILHNYLCNLMSPFKVALTGTPVENRLLDLWSIFDVVNPGLLGHRQEFIEKFEIPLRSLPPGSEQRRGLRAKLEQQLGPYFLRRTKSLLKEQLPPIKRHEPVFCEMSPLQRQRYGSIISSGLDTSVPFFTAMLKLLMVSSHPAAQDPDLLTTSDPETLIKLSGKLEKTLEMAERIKKRGDKLIIFEKFKALQQILSIAISTRFNVQPLCINGDVPPSSRKTLVDAWDKTEGFNVLIMSPRTGGAGLTIISANHVIHFTREYNPAIEMQATDRVYRIGQKKQVEVHYPTSVPTLATIEESIERHLDRIQTHKQLIADDFTMPRNMTEYEAFGAALSPEEAPGTALSKFLTSDSSSRKHSIQSERSLTVELDSIFGDCIEWHLLTNVLKDGNLLMLRNLSSGAGILMYDLSNDSSSGTIPLTLQAETSAIQAEDPFLRAIVVRVAVCASDMQAYAISEPARTHGIKVSLLDQLARTLGKFRDPTSSASLEPIASSSM